MKKLAKSLIDFLPASLSSPTVAHIRNMRERKIAKEWVKGGKAGPAPHLVKQQAIANLAGRYHCKTLVESGTYMGDMVEAQRKRFETIYSIELSQELWSKAVLRFKGQKHISIVQGDSGKVLAEIVPLLTQRALFWLDGHYSGGITAKGEKECPIYDELEAIIQHSSFGHVILIDDARLFNGSHDYPSLEELTRFAMPRLNGYSFELENDMICLLPEH